MVKQIGNTEYDITSDGYVFSRKSDRFISSVKNKNGAVKVNLYYDKKNHQVYVAQLVADAFIEKPKGIPESDLVVAHKDYNYENNRVENLYWTTRNELTKSMHDNGKYDDHHDAQKKKIKLINIEDGEILYFESITEAATFLKSNNNKLKLIPLNVIISNLSCGFRNKTKSYNYLVQTV